VDSFLFLLNLHVYLRYTLLHNINLIGSLTHITISRSLIPRTLNLNHHNIIFRYQLSLLLTWSLLWVTRRNLPNLTCIPLAIAHTLSNWLTVLARVRHHQIGNPTNSFVVTLVFPILLGEDTFIILLPINFCCATLISLINFSHNR
jgi:hypothetical protein